MAISLQNIYDRIQPYLLRKLGKEQLEWVFNDELITLANDVQKDVNLKCYANKERYYQLTDGSQQFVLAGEVHDILGFELDDNLFSTQKWCLTEEVVSGLKNTIVFKTAPTAGLRLDITYVRKTGAIEVVADTIDLPSNLEQDFMELLRTKVLTVFGDLNPLHYENDLKLRAIKMRSNTRDHLDTSPKNSMAGFDRDDFDYDLLDSEVGQENVTADINGVYTWTGEE